MAKAKIKARIHATVDLFVDNWSSGGMTTDLDKLMEQVRREGRAKLNGLIKDAGTIIGDPKVVFVLLEEER